MAKFDIDIYPVHFYVYKGISDKEFKKLLKKDSKGKASESFIDGLCGEFEGVVNDFKGHIVIRFKDKKPSTGVLVHECFHATVAVMEYVGVKMADESDEAWAYLLQEITNKVLEK